MSSNGDSFHSGSTENPRGNSYRYRASSRRGRSRGGMNDRSGQQRFQNTSGNFNRRHGGNQGEYRRPIPAEQESIDINDSSQFPSIQESSRAASKGGASNVSTSERYQDYSAGDQPIRQEVRNENNDYSQDPENRRSTGTHRGYYQNPRNYGAGHYSSTNSFAPRTYYTDRNYQYGNNRQRFRSQYNSNRGFQSGSNRRYPRGYIQPMPNVYIRPEPPFYAPAFMENALATQFQPSYTYHPRHERPTDPIQQVEFYFSEGNLTNDSHLCSLMDSEGWVNLCNICDFRRMKNFGLDVDEIASRLGKSDLVEIDLVSKKVRTKIEPLKWTLTASSQEVSTPPSGTNQETHFSDQNVTTYASSFTGMDETVNTSLPQPFHYGYPNVPYLVPGYSSQNQRLHGYPLPLPYYQSYYPVHYNEFATDPAYPYYPQYYFDNNMGPGIQNVTEEGAVGDLTKHSSVSATSESQNKIASNSHRVQEDEIAQQISELNVTDDPVSC